MRIQAPMAKSATDGPPGLPTKSLPFHDGLWRLRHNSTWSRPRPKVSIGQHRSGTNIGMGKAEQIERTRRETRAVADAKALVEKWNADVERRRDARLGHSPGKHLPQ